MKAHALLIALALPALAGCGATSMLSSLTGASVKPQAALVAANSFDALETAGTGYMQLPLCAAASSPACRTQAAAAQIVPAVRVGRKARDQIEGLLAANGGAAVPVASLNSLNAAIATLQSVYAQYSIAH